MSLSRNCFKPYYKWIIFNMKILKHFVKILYKSFKPYYKWIIFNIRRLGELAEIYYSFKPYYKWIIFNIY